MTTDHAVRPTEALDRAEAVHRLRPRVRAYEVREVGRFGGHGGGAAPARITLLRPNPDNATGNQLLVDHHLIPRRYWSWDSDTLTLTWSYGSGGYRLSGHVEFIPGEFTGFGSMTSGEVTSSVEVTLAPVSYTCRVSADTGAFWDTAKHSLVWPAPDGPKWKDAHWVDGALQFRYHIESDIFIGKPTYSVRVGFRDLQTGVDWEPLEGTFAALLNADLRMAFTGSVIDRPADNRGALPPPANGITSVMPQVMSFDFDGVGEEISGAMLIDNQPDVVYAAHGFTDNHAMIGMYRLRRADGEWTAVGLGVEHLYVDDQPVAALVRHRDRVLWRELDRGVARRIGLPVNGTLRLSADGSRVVAGSGVQGGHRTTYESLSRHRSAARQQPNLHRRATVMAERQESAPNPNDLKNMSQFRRNADNGGWIDKVQEEALKDFYKIMLNRMDKTMRDAYLPAHNDDLDTELRQIADTPGADGADPRRWYGTLSVAYLTSALSGTDDPYSQKLNALRAQAWLKDEVARSTVYQAQSPLLYARQFAVLNQGIHEFVIDQLANAAEYRPLIETDAAAWVRQMEVELAQSPERLVEMKKIIKTLKDAAQDDRTYWAYWYFRYCTQPAALRLLELMSLSGTILDGSEYTRRIQTNCAVLEQLDPGSTFVRQYAQVIQLFQLSNVLPKLIDYAGNTDTFTYSCTEIIKRFIHDYGDTKDPEFQRLVDDFREAVDKDWIRQVLDGFANMTSAIIGMYSWDQIAQKFEREWPRMSTIPIGAAKMITLIAVSAGTTAFVFGVLNLKDLDGPDVVRVVLGGVDVFVQMASAIVKRGVAYVAVLRFEGVSWANFVKAFDGDLMWMAETRMSRGVGIWLVGTGRSEWPVTMDGVVFMMNDLDEELTILTRIFGRNLDEFVATRLGAMFAIVNIVLSAMALAGGGSAMEIAANALFLVSACLELIAAAGAWALGAAGIAEIGGYAVASIAAGLNCLAAFAAIAGTIIILVLLFGTRPKSPVELFAEGPATEAGFFMPYDTAIDYFRADEPEPGHPQLVGVSVRAGEQYLTMRADGTVVLGALDRTSATCFYLSTDSSGQARFTSTLLARPGDPLLTPYSLTIRDGAVSATRTTTDGKDQWLVAAISPPRAEPPARVGGRPDTMPFLISHVDGATIWFMAVDNGRVVASRQPYVWWLKMEATRPTNLSMPDLTIFTYQNDGEYWPVVGQPGSRPRRFAISRPVPPFLTFDPTNGMITWTEPGVLPPVMPRQEYEIKVTNEIGGAGPVTFAIEVKDGAGPKVAG